MSRRSNLTLLGLTLAAVAGVLLLALPPSPLYQAPKLGLDLQGGLEIVLRAVPPKGHPDVTDEDMDRSVEIMRTRVDKLGVSEPEIRKQGENQISVQLPGISDPQQAAELIGKTAQLWLFDLQANLIEPTVQEEGLVRYPAPQDNLFQLLKQIQPSAKRGTPEEYYLVDPKAKKVVLGPDTTTERLRQRWLGLERNEGKKFPKRFAFYGVPEERIILNCGIGERYCAGVPEPEPTKNYYYLFKFNPENKEDPVPEMTGADLKLDGTRQDFRGGEGPIVLMEFTDAGADKFHEITRELAARGRAASGAVQNKDAALQSFAIVLDREIKSSPTIDWDQNPDGISGGAAEITGIGDIGEAKDLALVLQTGALPLEFEQIDLTEVSATLGADSLREAITASLIGLAVVAIFLLLVYRFLGLVAIVGLALNAVFLYAVILLFDVTLTLPGFAGMVLAIGIAADANIVIFERIKEEAADRRSVRAAISAGYRKGFATIVDANVVTALTALILFAVATGGVRGFAFMLLLGTVISIFTAVFATRALLGMLAGFRWFDNPKFMGASAQKMARWQMFDAVGKRRIWFTAAGILIAISIGSLIFKGLNLGIDFRGGTQMTLETERATNIADVRRQTTQFGLDTPPVVQGVGEEVRGGFREFQIKTEPLSTPEQTRLTTTLEADLQGQIRGIRNVSASFSQEIMRGAIYAVLISFVLITIFISLRFQWRFAVPILRTIANDGLIALGIYSLSGREVSAATVAAFLTIIGYSIYDTIIIFDRVRENLPLMRRSSIKEIINTSLWETVRRSIATTIITLLPVGALFLFGGAVLKDFAFAILVGIGISAFSTIFIAAPFLAVLLERSPEYKGRTERAMRRAEEAPEPGEKLVPVGAGVDGGGDGDAPMPATTAPVTPAAPPPADAKRERRRQRRRARPHGRAR
ncbi:MAG TPA: protein translocase subunit SecD [Gaiellaceae bacterium]|nr:protein translocase subunit SecD [Gaiellaceae bacterium]